MGYMCASVMNCDEGYNERTEQPQARGNNTEIYFCHPRFKGNLNNQVKNKVR